MNRLGALGARRAAAADVDELIERIDAVTLDDLRELAASCWRPSGCRAAGIGPDEDAFRGRGRAGVCPGAERRGMIRVAVAGAAGRMGQTVCAAVEGADDMELTGRADPALGTTLADVLGDADVVVDFTRPDTALDNAPRVRSRPACTSSSGRPASTSTAARRRRGRGANVFVAPNFAIGAVLMMRFAAEASRAHGSAPRSSSCTTTASSTRRAAPRRARRELMEGDVPIHSVRLPGLVAHQEVILGDVGQTLTIRHDSTDRKSFMPGVLLAVRRVGGLPESPVVGLEHLLFDELRVLVAVTDHAVERYRSACAACSTRGRRSPAACAARGRPAASPSRPRHGPRARPRAPRPRLRLRRGRPRDELVVVTLWEEGEDPAVPRRFTDALSLDLAQLPVTFPNVRADGARGPWPAAGGCSCASAISPGARIAAKRLDLGR